MNVDASQDNVSTGWTSLCRCLYPPVDIYSAIKPFSNKGTRFTRAGTFRRIDHVFTSLEVLDFVGDAAILAPLGFSDHHMIVVRPSGGETAPSSNNHTNSSLWRSNPQVLRIQEEMERLWAAVFNPSEAPSWNDWLTLVGLIRGHLFNRSRAQAFKQVPRREELSHMQALLDSFVIQSLHDAKQFAYLTHLYQMARLVSFPEERHDVLEIQREVPQWPSSRSKADNEPSPLRSEEVVAFFGELYEAGTLADSGIPSATSQLRFQNQWPDPDSLAAPFTKEEVALVIESMKLDAVPGHAGIPLQAFRCAPETF